MKKTTSLLLLALMVFSFAGVVSAGKIQKIDLNQNHKISDYEVKASKTLNQVDKIRGIDIDSNNDGKVSKTEVENGLDIAENLDRDHNKVITKLEGWLGTLYKKVHD